MAITSAAMITNSSKFLRFGVQCSDNSNPRRGFGSNTNIKVSIPCFSFHFTHFGHTHNLIICSLLSALPSFILASFLNGRKRAAAPQGRRRVWRYNKENLPLNNPMPHYLLVRESLLPSSRCLSTQLLFLLSLTKAPGLSSRFDGKSTRNSADTDFEQRLQAVKRSALEQKRVEEIKEFGPIDYDAPVKTENKTIGLGTKIGVGVAVLVFGLVFALGDFLPSGSDGPTEEATVINKKLSEDEQDTLRARLKQYELTLSTSPKDSNAIEGAAVTLVELGEYTRAASLLQDLAKEKPGDPDVFRLLGEIKYELKDYDGSAAAYRISAAVSKNVDFEVLRGHTNALLAAKKPDEAVQVLLASRARLNSGKSSGVDIKVDGNGMEIESQEVDPIQVDLLLGKAYSDWGHVSDAVSVYDQLISSHPDDFRGYLAKGIILKENGNVGDAERMFIQARFFAPEKAKALVDRYARK